MKAKNGDYSVCMRVIRARVREELASRVGERCFLGLVLREGGAFSISEMI